jgi:hypothetical protein
VPEGLLLQQGEDLAVALGSKKSAEAGRGTVEISARALVGAEGEASDVEQPVGPFGRYLFGSAQLAPMSGQAFDVGDSVSLAGSPEPFEPGRAGLGSAGAAPMIGTSSSIALWTAVPIDPEELSTDSSTGEMRSSRVTAPSPASTGFLRATLLISLTASLTRWTAGWDRHPKAVRRKRALNSQR